MPLEMVDDPQDQKDYNDNDSNSGGGGKGGFTGGGGGLLNFIPLLFSLFRGGGKGIIWILLIVAAGYFMMNSKSCSGVSEVVSQFTKGGKLDPNEFKKASVYEGLEDDNTKNPLPERVSLERFAPDRKNQGKQGSCVAWSSGYAARTIIESSSKLQDPNSVAFSPAFLYNQIGLDGCQGSYIIKAMEFMTQKGAVPFDQFPYDENDCSRGASQNLWNFAAQNKMHGFNRLTEDDGVSNLNLRAIKEHLAKDAPVVIGMMVGGSFMEGMLGQKVWHPNSDDYSQMGFGGHALCVIGYDDGLEGGAFQIMNSWGHEWGENGIGWVKYGDFKQFVREAYGVDPMPKSGAALNVDFECSVGLVDNDTKQNIPLRVSSGNTFATTSPIKKGTKFKIEIKNAIECYIYLFTPKADGSSFVLFPYKPIHSPYCGITGTRLFPRKESIRADEVGNKDFMGVVVSKQPLDYNALNTAINSSTQSSFAGKLNEVISSASIKNVKYNSTNTGAIYFKADASEKNNVVGCVVEIDKQ
ncbi:C1 family peptidase [Ferruginibacter lapsinanis]|uniref:C1 family peptidase n=1 Tax=Ferruginibacter lapsinanis TaxID=563172 RepID=UPI001E5A4E57|nr:C1 family peptidase [Ferruginibacter lapsinanis]UEG51309.1 C1 family peptidase [Ferruginibacter lapsinanis]